MNQLEWDGLRLLLAVQRAGSLRRAAQDLTISQPTLGRRLQALEDQLGTPLIVRHARGVDLTEDGKAVLEAAHAVQTRLDDLQRALTGRAATVAGRVRISCTEPVAMALLPESLRRLADAHPGLSIDVVVDAHASDLDRREADVAIRMFQPQHASLVARRVGTTFTAFYASRAYLEAHGEPTTLAELAGHRVIGPDRDPLFVQQASRLGFGASQMTYRTDSFATVRAWVQQGVAIGAQLGAVAELDGLVRLFEPLVEHPVWLVTHPDLYPSAAVAAVWARLAADLPPLLDPRAPREVHPPT